MTTAALSQTTPPPAMLRNPFEPTDTFPQRHLGPNPDEVKQMLAGLGYDSLDALTNDVVPAAIRLNRPLKLEGCGEHRGEHELLKELKTIASQNKVYHSFIGMGYHGTITPPVILRNILENPGWYTQYTPYQAEISQGRLEALLNFQTMVSDLTGLPLANASMLDEATAAAEAMAMAHLISSTGSGTGVPPVNDHGRDARATIQGPATRNGFFVAADCHPQTIAVIRTRAEPVGIAVHVGDLSTVDFAKMDLFGVLAQYPTTDGRIVDYAPLAEAAHKAGALLICAADLLALTLIKPPGEFGADIAIGSAQRFGVPMGYGGPHAAFMATRTEYARQMPGRLVGVSKDAHGNVAYRLAIQTREQHIKRERATSNICTSQVLLAIMAGMYAAYHGPKGLRKIARRVHALADALADGLRELGHEIGSDAFFDTLRVKVGASSKKILQAARQQGMNLRDHGDGTLGISLDETTQPNDLNDLLAVFSPGSQNHKSQIRNQKSEIENRQSPYLSHPIFSEHHSEHEMLRYLHRLQAKDLSLTTSMIPLGSCTMKLNATSQMIPVTWPEFAHLHPYAPADQAQGYRKLFDQLEAWLAEITGFAATSLQPNAGSQGEYAGLLAIRAYHAANHLDRVTGPVITVNDADLKRVSSAGSLEVLRKVVRDTATHRYGGTRVVNQATGWTIMIPRQGIKHATRHRHAHREQLISLFVTPQLLQHASWVASHTDKSRRSDIVAVHEFAASLAIEGVRYDSTLIVREHKDGRRFYNQTAIQMTTPAYQTGAASRRSLGHRSSAGVDTSIVGDPRPEVKPPSKERNICLIPVSAHGTNPASAVMAGFKVVPVACDKHGNIDLHDLRAKAEEHKEDLAALMITYPSTHGVFEPNVGDVIKEVHRHGGLVYMDGANMNAQAGLCRPGDIGADVCHLNLHKTFCIPHGGGGPGMGPICVNEKLKPFLPSPPLPQGEGLSKFGAPGPVSAAPFGSAAILPIPWVYIALMGAEGLRKATQVAILNANYMAHRLKDHYPILYTGLTGRVAHEFILDCRQITKAAGVSVEDIAKRLMDYGFHAPTMSFPVAGTLMIEPTESESLHELDRLCDALIFIRKEIAAVERGEADKTDNVLRGAPHTAAAVTADDWSHNYSRQQAAYPAPWSKIHKYWPPVGRIDNPYGDRNLVCSCPPMEQYQR